MLAEDDAFLEVLLKKILVQHQPLADGWREPDEQSSAGRERILYK